MHTHIHSQLLERCDLDGKIHLQTALAAHPLLERTAFHEAGHEDMGEARTLLERIVDDQERKRCALRHGANVPTQEGGNEITKCIALYLAGKRRKQSRCFSRPSIGVQ